MKRFLFIAKNHPALLLILALFFALTLRFFDTFPNGWDQAEYAWGLKSNFFPHSPYVLYFFLGQILDLLFSPPIALSLLSLASGGLAIGFFYAVNLRLVCSRAPVEALSPSSHRAFASCPAALFCLSFLFVLQGATQARQLDGLDQGDHVVEAAALAQQLGGRRVLRRIAGDDDDPRRRFAGGNPLDQLDAVDIGHHHIDNHHGRLEGGVALHECLAVGHNLGLIAGAFSDLADEFSERPVVIDDQIQTRIMMPLSLSYDHRVVDGATAARFLNEVIGYLKAPSRLLLAT